MEIIKGNRINSFINRSFNSSFVFPSFVFVMVWLFVLLLMCILPISYVFIGLTLILLMVLMYSAVSASTIQIIVFMLLPVNFYQIGNQSVKFWQIAQLILFIIVCFKVVLTAKVKRIPLLLLIAFVLLSISFSLLNSMDFFTSLRQLSKLFLCISIVFTCCQVTRSLKQFDHLFLSLMIMGLIVCFVGNIQFVLSNVFHLYNVMAGYYVLRPTATFSEPGWFGIYSSYLLIICLTTISNDLRRVFSKNRIFLIKLLLIVSSIGFAISLTRGSWIAAIATIFLMWCYDAKYYRISNYIPMLIVGFIVMIFVFPWMGDMVIVKFLDIHANNIDSSASARLYAVKVEFHQIWKHPIIGNGIGTWGLKVLPIITYGRDIMSGGSSSNILSSILFDTGMVGLVSTVFFYFYLLLNLLVKLRLCNEPMLRIYANVCVWGFICFLINAFFNPIHLTGMYWGHLALCILTIQQMDNKLNMDKQQTINGN